MDEAYSEGFKARLQRFTACWWIWLGKYVLRVGKPWGHPYRYAWRPLVSFFRVLR